MHKQGFMDKRFRSLASVLVVMIVVVLLAGSVLDASRRASLPLFENQGPDAQDTANQLTQICATKPTPKSSKKLCYAAELEKVALAYGIQTAFEILGVIQEKDEDAQGCHLIAHGIGRGTFMGNPAQWLQAIASPYAQRCSYGAVHGVLEKYDATAPEGWMSNETFSAICNESISAQACYHGLGHITLVNTQGDIKQGIEICSGLSKTKSQSACFRGLFMEYGTAFMLRDHGLLPKELQSAPVRFQNTEKLCRSLQQEAAEACWNEIPHAAIVHFGSNVQAMFDFCHTAQTPKAKQNCKLHTVDLFNNKRKYDLFASKDLCTLEVSRDPGFEEKCYVRLATSIFATNQERAADAVTFCGSLDQEFQDACFKKVTSRFTTHRAQGAETFQEICAAQPEQIQQYCREHGSLK